MGAPFKMLNLNQMFPQVGTANGSRADTVSDPAASIHDPPICPMPDGLNCQGFIQALLTEAAIIRTLRAG